MPGKVKPAIPPDRPLTDWEREAIALNVRGFSRRQIAARIGVSETTIAFFFSPDRRQQIANYKAALRKRTVERRQAETQALVNLRETNKTKVIRLRLTSAEYSALRDYAEGLQKHILDVVKTAVLAEIEFHG